MGDDRIVVDHEVDGNKPPFRPAWWVIAVGLVTVAVIVLSSGPDDAHPVASTTTVSAPTVEVPPTLPPGEVVAETIRWEAVAGLEHAVHIGGVVSFQEAHWVIGRRETDLVAWRSEDPSGVWTEMGVLEEGAPGLLVEDVEVVDGSLLVAASRRWNEGGGVVYGSADGQDWARYELETGQSDRPGAVVEEIIAVDGGVVMTGHGHSLEPPDTDLDRLAPEVRELVLGDKAWLARGESEIQVLVPPAISVATLPAERTGLPEEPSAPTPEATDPFLWWGPGPGDLEARARPNQPLALSATRLPDGRLVGQTGIRLAFSRDGLSWDPDGPFFGAIAGFAPWHAGFAVVVSGEEPAYWSEEAGEPVPLLPEELRESGPSSPVAPATGDWGLALARGPGGGQSLIVPEPILVASTESEDLRLVNPILLELRRDGEPVWTQSVDQVRVELERDGRLRFGPERDTISVKIEDWLETLYVMSGNGRPSRTAGVIHTVDGEEWSHSTWEAISGSDTVAGVSLFGVDDFLLVVDQATFPDLRVNDVAVGLPLD